MFQGKKEWSRENPRLSVNSSNSQEISWTLQTLFVAVVWLWYNWSPKLSLLFDIHVSELINANIWTQQRNHFGLFLRTKKILNQKKLSFSKMEMVIAVYFSLCFIYSFVHSFIRSFMHPFKDFRLLSLILTVFISVCLSIKC